jgi:hypothetical protein
MTKKSNIKKAQDRRKLRVMASDLDRALRAINAMKVQVAKGQTVHTALADGTVIVKIVRSKPQNSAEGGFRDFKYGRICPRSEAQLPTVKFANVPDQSLLDTERAVRTLKNGSSNKAKEFYKKIALLQTI